MNEMFINVKVVGSKGLCKICRAPVQHLYHSINGVYWHDHCWLAQERIEELEAKVVELRRRQK